MKNNNNEHRQMSPAFNVCLPFHRVIMIQMNTAMRDLLSDFFHELCDGETPEEVLAFRDALDDPSIYVHASKPQDPSFLVCEKYMKVIVVEINEAMRDLLCEFINDVEGLESQIMAFNLALTDPFASLEIRLEKLRRDQGNQNEQPKQEEEQGKVRRRKLTMA